jgi:hypothetical protein
MSLKHIEACLAMIADWEISDAEETWQAFLRERHDFTVNEDYYDPRRCASHPHDIQPLA